MALTTACRLAALFAAACCLALPAQAQWVWKDAGGQVHASDLPPPRDVPAANIISKPDAAAATRRSTPAAAPAAPAASGSASGAAAKTRTDPSLEARRKQAEQDQAAQKKAEEDKQSAARAENCQRAKSNLATLESGMRMVRMNDKGEREVMDDKARAEDIAVAKRVIAQDCK
jgi:hypothetical protein